MSINPQVNSTQPQSKQSSPFYEAKWFKALGGVAAIITAVILIGSVIIDAIGFFKKVPELDTSLKNSTKILEREKKLRKVQYLDTYNYAHDSLGS